MERHIRNQVIAEAYEAGETLTALAARFDLKTASIRRIIQEIRPYSRLQDERPLPAGISVISAVTIEQALGIWPSATNLNEIENRRMDLLRSGEHGRRVKIALAEIGSA